MEDKMYYIGGHYSARQIILLNFTPKIYLFEKYRAKCPPYIEYIFFIWNATPPT